MKELTLEETLNILCAPEAADDPDESDFIADDEAAEEKFANDLIAREIS